MTICKSALGKAMSLSISDYITSSSAGTLQYGGLTSDTNWVDVVDDLMSVERVYVNRLETWKAEWNNKISALQGLESQLLQLESKASDLSTASDFYARLSSSSDESVLTVTNLDSAVPGAHSITVATATHHKLSAQGFADTDTTGIGDSGGDLVVSIGDLGTLTIDAADIDADTTLEGLRDLINTTYAGQINDGGSNDGQSALSAEIIDDGSVTNPYRLVLIARDAGTSHTISVASNPTTLNFTTNGISAPDTSGLTATTTTDIEALGRFGADKSSLGSDGARTYTFTGPSSTETIGEGDWTLSWTGDNGGGSGTVNLGSAYQPGDTLEIEEGIFVQFGAGDFGAGETFTVKAFNTGVDDVELDNWNGTASVSSDGNYMGGTNKTFTFTIAGNSSYTVGEDSFAINWEDEEGNSGTVSVTADDYADIEVFQGIKLDLTAGTVSYGDTFSINVSTANLQDGNDSGLAQAEVETHSGFVDTDKTAVTAAEGVFAYSYGGVTRSITVPAGTTLVDLQDLINLDSDNPGVTAMIVDDGQGLDTSYHLVLSGTKAGAAYTIDGITHTLDNFAKDGSTGYGFSQTQKAQNAMLKVDGYPTDEKTFIQRASNTIGDIINGVTMTLVDTGEATISVSNDVNAIKTNITELVDTANTLFAYISDMTQYDDSGEGESNGPMIGNYGFQIVQNRLKDLLTSALPGFSEDTDPYLLLAQLGIESDPDENGAWVIDDAQLGAILAANLDAVADFFIQDDITGKSGLAELIRIEAENLTNAYDEANPGIVQVLIQNYENIVSNVDDKIENEERRLAQVEARYNTKFTQLETTLGTLAGTEAYIQQQIDSMKS
jgi:flagellar capping protein FliD